ncbi:MAG: hypothetical protein NTV88_04725 [Candidatus Micrarchaeota archaeon]|nr:hypothetical protein [Candidatus Micrarchaeota archaeon]
MLIHDIRGQVFKNEPIIGNCYGNPLAVALRDAKSVKKELIPLIDENRGSVKIIAMHPCYLNTINHKAWMHPKLPDYERNLFALYNNPLNFEISIFALHKDRGDLETTRAVFKKGKVEFRQPSIIMEHVPGGSIVKSASQAELEKLDDVAKDPNLMAVLLVGMYYKDCIGICDNEFTGLLLKHGREDVKIAVNFMLTVINH